MKTNSVFLSSIVDLINASWFRLPVLAVAILCYGFILVNPTVFIDDTATEFYFDKGGVLSQGRFGQFLLQRLLGIYQFGSITVPFLAVLFLIISVLLWSSLFKSITDNKIKPLSFIVFSSFFISYPLITEIFNYHATNLNLNIGLSIIPLVLIIVFNFDQNPKIRGIVYSSLLLTLSLSLYESLAPVYLFGVFSIFLLRFFYSNDDKDSKTIALKFFKYLVPFILGLALYYSINLLLKVFIKLPTDYAQQSFGWGNGIIKTFKVLIDSSILYYGLNSLIYLPITLLVLAILFQIIMAFVFVYKYKKFSIIGLFLGSILSLFSLSILMGFAAPYRTCTLFTLFVSFTFMLLIQFVNVNSFKMSIRIVVGVILLIILIRQINDINKWFYVEHLRYQEEVNVSQVIGNTLQSKFTANKPVVFIGTYELSDNINQYTNVPNNTLVGIIYKKLTKKELNEKYAYKFTQTNVSDFLGWSTGTYFYKNGPSETHVFFKSLGYDLTPDNKGMYNEAKGLCKTMPKFPKKGYIHETSKSIIVNLGNCEPVQPN